ncbi:aminoglycoside phosphotransferase [Geobacillus stearothermophilus]|uniref:aminoglycoside phosphotransferase n=1 Tax=Geobacillus stearothermophilus TaxID=1422 RepID=UPI002E1C746D|nr:aminoglycoside phosphotransferase [Geobacillus stearothermophilus]MED3770244.1 aminoglycoside phosphotransferase [Geobacillus stearothermophilus]MED3770879.1 aminoglycoside phosphotransferase [Geobacillus stearothermophilus]
MARNNNQVKRDAAGRLFFLLDRQYRLVIQQVVALKPHVLAIAARQGMFVAKAYRFPVAAARHAWLLAALRKTGFSAAPAPMPIGRGGVVEAGGCYWLLTEYVAGARPISFAAWADAADGLHLLERYHTATANIASSKQEAIGLPRAQLYDKWRRRYEEFCRHLPVVETIMDKEDILFTLSWADYCLSTCREHAPELTADSAAIIHGDVASHNFLRTTIGHIYLIDYDAAALASPGLDYCQYANRLLPHIGWSYSTLARFAPLRRWLEKRWFLHALLFPADVFREWRSAAARRRPLVFDRKRRERFVRRLYAMLQ